jgi:hypothetical protein
MVELCKDSSLSTDLCTGSLSSLIVEMTEQLAIFVMHSGIVTEQDCSGSDT